MKGQGGSPRFIVEGKCQGASRCVPLCVERLICSIAQPSPSGKSSGTSSGKNRHMVLAASVCPEYLILGPAPGGSAITSFSRGTERSTKRRFTGTILFIICRSYIPCLDS